MEETVKIKELSNISLVFGMAGGLFLGTLVILDLLYNLTL